MGWIWCVKRATVLYPINKVRALKQKVRSFLAKKHSPRGKWKRVVGLMIWASVLYPLCKAYIKFLYPYQVL